MPTIVERISARAVAAESPLVMPASSKASITRPRNAGPEPASAVAASNSRSSSVTTVPICPSQPSTRASASRAGERPAGEAQRARAHLDADVRHAAEERHALLQHVLERRRRDARRDRDDRGAGVDQLGGLAQHALDVDRLDGDQDDVGAAHELARCRRRAGRRGARPGARRGPSRGRSRGCARRAPDRRAASLRPSRRPCCRRRSSRGSWSHSRVGWYLRAGVRRNAAAPG